MLLSFKDKFLFFRKKTIDSASSDVVSFVVPGMTCEGCANKIKQGLYNHPETKAVFINIPDKLVKIQSSLPAEEIKNLLSQLDYPPQN
jgi:copper chaperone CopZ